MSRHVFSEKQKKIKNKKNVVCCSCDWCFKGLQEMLLYYSQSETVTELTGIFVGSCIIWLFRHCDRANMVSWQPFCTLIFSQNSLNIKKDVNRVSKQSLHFFHSYSSIQTNQQVVKRTSSNLRTGMVNNEGILIFWVNMIYLC